VLVKESSDLTLQLSCVIQLTHGTRMFKKFALDFCGKIIPLHDDCGAEAPQNMLLFVSERCLSFPKIPSARIRANRDKR
jgi:hypothetical protein